MTTTNHCGTCSICCNYVTVETEDPSCIEDVDHLLWLLAHKNVSLFIDEGWFVQFTTPCSHHDGKCTIYARRMDICKDYELTSCENSGKHHRIYIPNRDELLSFIQKHKPALWEDIKDLPQIRN